MRLQEIMAKEHISQNQLSKRSGVSQSFISAMLAGDKQPTITVAKKLARALDVTLDELVGEVNDPPDSAA